MHKGQLGRIAGTFSAELRARFSDRKFARYVTTGSNADLNFLRDLLAAGKLKPFVERTYPMTEAAEAVRYLNEGHARGKLVINVD